MLIIIPNKLRGHSTKHPPNQVDIIKLAYNLIFLVRLIKSINLTLEEFKKGVENKIRILIIKPTTPPTLLGTLREMQ